MICSFIYMLDLVIFEFDIIPSVLLMIRNI